MCLSALQQPIWVGTSGGQSQETGVHASPHLGSGFCGPLLGGILVNTENPLENSVHMSQHGTPQDMQKGHTL